MSLQLRNHLIFVLIFLALWFVAMENMSNTSDSCGTVSAYCGEPLPQTDSQEKGESVNCEEWRCSEKHRILSMPVGIWWAEWGNWAPSWHDVVKCQVCWLHWASSLACFLVEEMWHLHTLVLSRLHPSDLYICLYVMRDVFYLFYVYPILLIKGVRSASISLCSTARKHWQIMLVSVQRYWCPVDIMSSIVLLVAY